MRLYILFFPIFTLLYSCDSSTTTSAPERMANGPKNGEWINRRADGSIKTRVNYKNGVKDGMSYLFHKDGKTIQLQMPYVKGKRYGTSQKFFNNGQLYAETNYKDDLIHGTRKTYYRSGQLKSTVSYAYGQPHSDLQEYYQSGNEKPQPVLTYTRFGNNVRVTVDSEDCKSPEFYIYKLTDGEPLPSINDMTYLRSQNAGVDIDLNVFTPSYLAMQDIICKCTTTQGNPLILKKRLSL